MRPVEKAFLIWKRSLDRMERLFKATSKAGLVEQGNVLSNYKEEMEAKVQTQKEAVEELKSQNFILLGNLLSS